MKIEGQHRYMTYENAKRIFDKVICLRVGNQNILVADASLQGLPKHGSIQIKMQFRNQSYNIMLDMKMGKGYHPYKDTYYNTGYMVLEDIPLGPLELYKTVR